MMRTLLFLAPLVLALGALLYLPGTLLWNWPGRTAALASFAPLFVLVGFVFLQRAAAAHDRVQGDKD